MTAGLRMLETRRLTKRYPGADRPAVREVDLSVECGELLGVVGESGSGKTTLLRLVAGLEVPTSGTVAVAGRRVSGEGAWVPPEHRPLGMLFQEGALFPHLTLARNVEFGVRRRPAEERRARREAVLGLVGLEGYGDRHPHQLSGGEQRRAALARALAPEPDLLLLDEPFTGLDERLTARLAGEVAAILRDTGTTALIVLHDTDEVLPLADRVAVLREGRLAQVGVPRQVYARPATEYVARLFGPVNVVAARRRDGDLWTPVGRITGPEGGPGGEPVRVCLRPEDFEVGETGGDAVPAVVEGVGYRGDRTEARLRVEAGDEACVLVVHVPGDREVRSGQRLRVRTKPGRGHVLGEGPAPSP